MNGPKEYIEDFKHDMLVYRMFLKDGTKTRILNILYWISFLCFMGLFFYTKATGPLFIGNTLHRPLMFVLFIAASGFVMAATYPVVKTYDRWKRQEIFSNE